MMTRRIECEAEPCGLRGAFDWARSRPSRTPTHSARFTTLFTFGLVSRMTRSILFLYCALLLSLADLSAQQPLPAEGDEAQLINVLNSDAELFEKAKACQRLAVIGTSKSIPVLAGFLGDEELSHYARTGLEANPDSKVDRVFQQSLEELSGRQLLGVINSIGVRARSGATDPATSDSFVRSLGQLAANQDVAIAEAAIASLGEIATPPAVFVLTHLLASNHKSQLAVADACLTAADRLLSSQKTREAANLLEALRAADPPKHINVATRFGELRAKPTKPEARSLMTQYLGHDDHDLFRIGLELAHGLTDEETTKQLVDQYDALSDRRKVLVLHVLGSRGERSALATVVKASTSERDELRIAGLRVLGTLGDVSVVDVLLDASASSDDVVADTARDSLAELKDDRVKKAVLERLPESSGKQKIALVDVVGRRGLVEAMPLLTEYMGSDDRQLSRAAVDALAMTIGVEQLPAMVDQLLSASSADQAAPVKDALSKACTRMADRAAATDVLVGRMEDASDEEKAELLNLLIYVGGEDALAAIAQSANGDDDRMADAATQALGKWLTPDVAPALLDLAQNGNEKYRVRCLRGYIRVIRQFGLRSGVRLQMSKTAFNTATRDAERALVLDTMTRFPSPQGLKFVTAQLKKNSLRDDVAKSAIVICEKIVNQNRDAVAAAIPAILNATKDPGLKQRAEVVAARAKGR